MRWSLLPAELGRWDQSPGGDLLVVPVWQDVRPVRGAAGLLDWRLCGALSRRLRDGHFGGARGERLLMPTQRLPWRAALAVGVGESEAFSEDAYLAALDAAFAAMRGLSLSTLAGELPGRDLDRISAERAAVLLRAAVASHEHVVAMDVIDTPPALKTISAVLGCRPSPRAAHAPRPAP